MLRSQLGPIILDAVGAFTRPSRRPLPGPLTDGGSNMSKLIRTGVSSVFLWTVVGPSLALAQTPVPPFTPPEDLNVRKANVMSEGTRMTAELFSFKTLEGKKLPTVILCHGWGGTIVGLRPDAVAFARAGYLAIVFDYRGWGASDSRVILTRPAPADRAGHTFQAEVREVREVVDPLDQTTDLLNVIHWACGEPQCDAELIGLWGSSYSGGHVIYAAARDARVKATVSQVPALDSRWVVATPSDREQTLREATQRARGEIGYPEPGVRVIKTLRGAPIRERMINYAPVDDVEKAPKCAMLFILAESEEYFDNKDHAGKAYERAKGPRKLVTIPGITHYGIYGTARPQAQKLAIEWFDAHLKPHDSGAGASQNAAAAKDWSMYNYDVLGSRHNRGETAINPSNAGRLVEKWRFPPEGSGQEIGVIHCTPSVVGGFVYFGTATDAAFYKLTPDGKLAWSYRNPERGREEGEPAARATNSERLRPAAGGMISSPLVSGDSVYFTDLEGWIYALDRETGAERWKVSTRAASFPGAHPLNLLIASPILADGKVLFGGGALEQGLAGSGFYRGSTGRGFLVALDPKTGRVVWKYDLGPKPEPLEPPITIKDSYGEHTFYYGPATSTIWSTPSYNETTGTIYFGTDVNTAPRRPTAEDPRNYTRESCAVVALDIRNGTERWVTQLNPGDVWGDSMRAYDPVEGRYKDESIGDTPKLGTIDVDGTATRVVGVGCKNGGYYVLNARDGRIMAQTPIYTGKPSYPLDPPPDRRMLALPGPIGGVQTGCASDGTTIYTNGIDSIELSTQETRLAGVVPPTSGRVVALSQDTRVERWRHERPRVASIGGPPPVRSYTDVGDPVGSGIAVANGVLYFTTVASGKLVALDAASGSVLKEIDLGPVWSGPSVSRGRVYVGTGNTFFGDRNVMSFFPKKYTGVLYCYGLPGEDEVDRLASGKP
jgi:outer membrane protein assembly factor BamB/dienelactone hydrolase